MNNLINFKKIELKETIQKSYDLGEEEKRILVYNNKTKRLFLKTIKQISLNKEYMVEYLKGNYEFYEYTQLNNQEILSLFKVLKSNIEIKKIHNVDWLFINGIQTVILTTNQVNLLNEFYER